MNSHNFAELNSYSRSVVSLYGLRQSAYYIIMT